MSEVGDTTHRYTVLPEIPDVNTLDIATYGSDYLKVTSSLYICDAMLDSLQHEYNMKIAGCYGSTYTSVSNIFRRKHMVIGQERPHIDSYEEIAPIQKAKEIYQLASAIAMLKKWRAEAEVYGAMLGAQEYGEKIISMGITPELFSYAQKHRASLGMTNDYDSVRNTLEGNPRDMRTPEMRNIDDMNEQIHYANEYARMQEEYPEDDFIGPAYIDFHEHDEEDNEEEEEEDDRPYIPEIRTIPTSILAQIVPFEEQEDLDGQPDNLDAEPEESGIPDAEIERLLAGEISIEDLMRMYASDERLADVLTNEQVERIKAHEGNLAESIGIAAEMFKPDNTERIKPYSQDINDSIKLAFEMFGVSVEVLPPDDDYWNKDREPSDKDDSVVTIEIDRPLLDTPRDDREESALQGSTSYLIPATVGAIEPPEKTEPVSESEQQLKGTEVVVYEGDGDD